MYIEMATVITQTRHQASALHTLHDAHQLVAQRRNPLKAQQTTAI
jgi:hypothetical protein